MNQNTQTTLLPRTANKQSMAVVADELIEIAACAESILPLVYSLRTTNLSPESRVRVDMFIERVEAIKDWTNEG